MALVIVEWLPELQRLVEAPRRSGLRRHACRLVVYATLLVAAQAVAQDVPAVLASQARAPASETTRSAETILASQPSDLVDRLMEEKMIVFQEIREEGPLRGGGSSTRTSSSTSLSIASTHCSPNPPGRSNSAPS